MVETEDSQMLGKISAMRIYRTNCSGKVTDFPR